MIIMEQFGDDLDTMQIQINIGAYECRICDNNFTSPIQLTVHYIILHGLLPCIHCMKLFENKQLLADHNEKYHTTHNYICPECLMNFPDDEQLFSHIFHIHSMKLCTFCEQPCPIDEYSQHIAMKHNVNEPTAMKIIIASDNQTEFICQLCHDNKPVNRLDKLFSHYLYFHKCILKSLLCCILKYNSIESMKFLGIDDNIHVKCFTCNLPYTWNIPKNYHKIYCQGYSCCTACNICFDSREKFNQHSKECQNLQSTIDFCDSCLLNGSIDESHVQSIHNISTVNKIWTNDSSLLNENNSCNFCTINFASQSVTLNEIIEHFRIVHKFNSIAILRLLKHRKNEIKTEETNDLTESGHQIMNQNNKRIRENIAEILTIDSDNVEYVMSFDTKMVKFLYSSASDYDSSDLEDEAPKSINIFQCDLCNTRFKSKFVYAKHMQETHGFTVNAFEFRCNVCKRKLASQRSLKKHNQNCHHKRTEQHRFKCQFCDFKCNKKGKIREHISEHVEVSYHPCHSKSIGFNCKYCHIIVWTKEQLSEHQLSRHTDELTDTYLMCSLCFLTFNNITTFRSHYMTRHFEFSMDGDAFQCTICRIVLFSIGSIRLHMQEMHPNYKLMQCAKANCKQSVTNELELRNHWKNDHAKSIFQCLECYKMFECKQFAENHMAVTHSKLNLKKL